MGKYQHKVIVGNVGTVHEGRVVKRAAEAFRQAKQAGGRSTQETVVWLRDGAIYKEYVPHVPAVRTHTEHFDRVIMGGRKSCPHCGTRLAPGEYVWGWYEYLRMIRRVLGHFCQACFEQRVLAALRAHADTCQCEMVFEVAVPLGVRRPAWLAWRPIERLSRV